MSQTIVGILGLLTIVAIVVTLFKSKTQPSIAFIVFPAILGLILVLTGYIGYGDTFGAKVSSGFDNLAAMIKAGFNSTAPTAALFVFSVLYFGFMTDAGMFDVIIEKLMGLIGNNVIGVCVMTSVIALVGHLDGGGASTFCIVVPSMLPVYKKMNMRPTTLLRIAVLGMGVLNLMPWAGPTMRAASVLGMESGKLWGTLIPVQIFGIVLCLAHAVLAGVQEKKRGAGLTEGDSLRVEGEAKEASELARPQLFIFNILLTVAVIAMLIWDVFPSYVPFMIGCAIALFVNYGADGKLHKKIINLHAGPALMMCSTLMGAAILMGVLTTGFSYTMGDVTNEAGEIIGQAITGMKTMSAKSIQAGDVPSVVRCLAGLVTAFLPAAIGQHLPLVIGFLSVPLALAFDTDSYFYGMLPVMIAIGQSFGVEALPIAVAMVVCRNCATFISPMVPATLLGTGLADVDIKDHIRCSFGYVWAFSIICMLFAILMGIMPI